MSKVVLINQFGEESINNVQAAGTDAVALKAVATKTIVGNGTGGTAEPTALTYLAVANGLPAKTGITAIAASGAITTVDNTKASIDTALASIVALHNQLLAALKVVS